MSGQKERRLERANENEKKKSLIVISNCQAWMNFTTATGVQTAAAQKLSLKTAAISLMSSSCFINILTKGNHI